MHDCAARYSLGHPQPSAVRSKHGQSNGRTRRRHPRMDQRVLSGRSAGCSTRSIGFFTQQRRAVVVKAQADAPKQRQQSGKKREVVVGIDLGTTNSAVAYIENGKPKCIPNEDGQRTTPSIVSFLPDGDVLVGNKARKQSAASPDSTFYSVKRLIGRLHTDPIVAEEVPRLSYQVSKDEAGRVTLPCPHVARGFIYPEEVSAQVLVQLLDDAEGFTGGEVTKAVISVPAYFTAAQREATANAGALAGLETVRIIREPVAAALAYGLNLKEDQTVLVFDLGGGTYDISLLEVGNGTIEVLSTGGDAHLGGDDWDQAIIDWLVANHLGGGKGKAAASGLDLKDPRLRANLRALAEAAKRGLSNADEVALRMPVGGPGGGPLQVVLTRAALEKLTQELWRRARLPLDQACWAAGVDLNALMTGAEEKRAALKARGVPDWKTATVSAQIRPKSRAALSKVLLVGGATRMPAVASFIRNMTGLEPEANVVNPDEAVALGAAVQAGILQGQVKDLMVMDQWQASLMRALAGLSLRTNPDARAAVEEQFDMGPSVGVDEEEAAAAREEAQILKQLEEEHAAEVLAAGAAGGSKVTRAQQGRAAGKTESGPASGAASVGSDSAAGRGQARASAASARPQAGGRGAQGRTAGAAGRGGAQPRKGLGGAGRRRAQQPADGGEGDGEGDDE